MTTTRNYEEAIEHIWKPYESKTAVEDERTREDTLRELVRYASLAPNSHNTQPWKFMVEESSITVLPDLTRSCPEVDPDDHHLYVSLGCAVENLVIAAKAVGLDAVIADASLKPQDGIKIDLKPCQPHKTDLFEAIPKRQCTRNEYDGQPLDQNELELLEKAAGAVGQGRARVVLVTDPAQIQIITDYVLEANTAQFADKGWINELKKWVRFSDAEAVSKGDGLAGKCMGNSSPSVPRWLGSMIFGFVVNPENEKFQRQIESSAGIAIFCSHKDDPAHWVQVGRCYERFALQATALGVKNAMINQPVEVETIRARFQKAMELDFARADLVVRFGKGHDMPKSLRRSVDDVIVQ